MLQAESAHDYSIADALAINALFKRLAERGRKIRTQKQVVNKDQTKYLVPDKVSSLDADATDADTLPLIGGTESKAEHVSK